MYPEFIPIYIGIVVIIALLIAILVLVVKNKGTTSSPNVKTNNYNAPTSTAQPSGNRVFCKNCATQFDASERVCPNCGTPR